ncbi:ABC transporter substrate-binding protein [Pelagibacterium montanilacus]|uniref:ABC transporter substrate-binding protein n=1 Tax=Pelagibacterium montanilacus TaxID=2185280 RepID=UPI000F8CACE7|nr:sugar ABC transporter substrate-binding protein [Pelagibacterium montanilacus]
MSLDAIKKATLAGAALSLMAGAAQAQSVRVTVAEYSSLTGPYFQEAAAAFEEETGTAVEIEVVPWDVLLQKLTTDISGGVNADLSIIGTRWLIDFVSEGIAAPLDDMMDADLTDRFIPAFLEPSVMDGQTYGLPIAASARAMYYNTELMEEAGVEAVPETWEELVAAAEQISALDDETFGFGLQGNEIETDVYFYYALWSYGGELIEEDGTSGLDSEAAYEAAALYKSMIDEGLTQPGVTSYSREDVQNLFKQGRVGMMITAPFLSNQIADEVPDLPYGVAAIPAGPDGDRGTYGVTDSIIMFENAQNKEGAMEFLNFIFSPEWRVRFSEGEGFLPVLTAVAEDPAFAEDPDLSQFTGLLPDARFAPVIPGWEEIAAITSDALQTIYLGDGEIEPTLNEAAERINAILQ